MKKLITILQVLPALVSGGVERGTVDISKAIVASGNISIVSSRGGKLENQILSHGAKYVKLPLHSKNPLVILLNSLRLALLVKKYKVDIIHARSRAPAWSAYIASKITNCKFITTFHGYYRNKGIIKKYYNSVMLRGQKVIAVSNFIKQHLLKEYQCDKSKISVIPRAVDLEYFNPKNIHISRISNLQNRFLIPDEQFIIVFPARLTPWKGHEVLLGALSLIKDMKIFCLIVGDTHQHSRYYKKLISLTAKLGIEDKVSFTGVVEDMPTLYMVSDLVVAPSVKSEAFGRIPIEAQSMQKIVIATKIGGYTETIIDGKTGFLVEPENPIALANKIKEVYSFTKKKKVDIGNISRKHVEAKFSLSQMQAATMKVYKKLIIY